MTAKAVKSKIQFIPREQILLTKELKKKVEKKVLECNALAKKLWGIEVDMPEIRYDLKRLVAGMAQSRRTPEGFVHRLRVHPVFLVENEKDYIQETIPHEMAHIYCAVLHPSTPTRRVESHGKEWKEIMVRLGVGPKPGQDWKRVIKSFYNPASLDIPPKRSYGPRKPGGRKVGDILALIKKLNKEEIKALELRLGISIKDIDGAQVTPPPKKPTKQELLAEKEYNELLAELQSEHFDQRPAKAVSVYGWALAVIKKE